MDSLVNYTLITNEIKLINNHISGQAFNINPQIHRKIESIDKNKTAVTYTLEIKSTQEKPFPIDLTVSLTGIFDTHNLEEKDVDNFLKVQSCQILFPQIRTIVATLTSSALMPPLLLPVVDARKLFAEEAKTEE